MWTICLFILAVVVGGDSINKSVYKIALTQKGYAQFLQYDVETPPLREFTVCTWVRVFELNNEQSIFTYVASGNNRVVRLWLDAGGRYVKISIDEKVLSSVPIDVGTDVWRHICLSYQSDHGAWALYMDARLVSCEAAQNLQGRVLPGGGSVIIGYGIANKGIPNGLEGEIFGVNMILTSTIERNHTIKLHPQFKQKTFHKNKIIGNTNLEYIVLGDMKSENLQKRARPVEFPDISNTSKSYIKLKTPYSFFEHDVGVGLTQLKAKPVDRSVEKEIFDFSATDKIRATENDKVNFWNIINEAGNIGKFKNIINTDISGSGTHSLPMISEYETPPPLGPINDYSKRTFSSKNPVSFYNIKTNNMPEVNRNSNNLLEISAIETPPPSSKNTKVYGQWTSSKFASSVLNYLKRINFNQREQKKTPPTIPLLKISDSFPYASDIKVSKIRPSFKFQRRNFIDKRLDLQKREAIYPQINVQILEDNVRDHIIESHAQTRPKHVEITSRGKTMQNKEHRFHRSLKTEQSSEEYGSDEGGKSKHFTAVSDFKIKKYSNTYENNKLLTILPFLKTLEYYIDNLESNKKEKNTNTNNDMYSKSLSNANKWHNVKSYSNDYTPRQINLNSPLTNDIQEKIDEVNKKLPSIRLKYKPDSQKIANVEDARIIQGRDLASKVSNQSNHVVDSVSLIKYNHGFLPHYDKKTKPSGRQKNIFKENIITYNNFNENSFNKNVKLGNALNERNVIGQNEEQNKQSFVGGDETVPDINRYRSDIDRENGSVPPSLGPRICKNVELYDRLFYVQPDGSIDVTHILSPVREKNIGIEFIMQNYRKCSLENTDLEKNPLLFIDWNKTPVRLFGGAYPKKTTDLCGFF
ncbi:uncharacterized protein [Epargyreus clarus]|uniref:uncharacterized protein n=1 Tax=Epargyreus clarus TaxID=520877 RepID=UPI003C2DF54F